MQLIKCIRKATRQSSKYNLVHDRQQLIKHPQKANRWSSNYNLAHDKHNLSNAAEKQLDSPVTTT
jgi:hypothetical protein